MTRDQAITELRKSLKSLIDDTEYVMRLSDNEGGVAYKQPRSVREARRVLRNTAPRLLEADTINKRQPPATGAGQGQGAG